MSVPKRIGDRVAIIPGDYVVIQSTGKGDRYLAEVVIVIDDEYERFYRTHDLWPYEYDVAGYVERLGEKVKRQQQAQEREIKLKKDQKKLEKLCGVSSDTTGSDSSKYDNKERKKREKKEIKCTKKRDKNFDRTCLEETPFFPDDGISLNFEDDEEPWRKNLANCGTNTGKPSSATNAGQLKINTKRLENQRLRKQMNNDPSCSSSGCCSQSCCGGGGSGQGIILRETTTTGSGPYCTDIVTSIERMPPLYGKCTPWRVSKKEMKKQRTRNLE